MLESICQLWQLWVLERSALIVTGILMMSIHFNNAMLVLRIKRFFIKNKTKKTLGLHFKRTKKIQENHDHIFDTC